MFGKNYGNMTHLKIQLFSVVANIIPLPSDLLIPGILILFMEM